MRILVFGASGKLGSAVCARLARDHEVVALFRDGVGGAGTAAGARAQAFPLPWTSRRVVSLLQSIRPTLIINAVGVTVLPTEPGARSEGIAVNAVWPGVLAAAAAETGSRIVHVSTDGVFSGVDGGAPYHEDAVPSALDPYCASKLLGEINAPQVTNVRLSFVGWSRGGSGLLEWGARNAGGRIQGYAGYRFNVLTASGAADALAALILVQTPLRGVLHLPGVETTKLALLEAANRIFGWRTEIASSPDPRIDRRLAAERFLHLTSWRPPRLDDMLSAIAGERAR